jgi:hypothetical protein
MAMIVSAMIKRVLIRWIFIVSLFPKAACPSAEADRRFSHFSMERWNPVDMDDSGRILRIWIPAIHAGMTE